jgi:predicted ester cyclase
MLYLSEQELPVRNSFLQAGNDHKKMTIANSPVTIFKVLLAACHLFMIFSLTSDRGFAQGKTVEKYNKDLINLESVEIGNKGNLDKIPELFTEDFVRHFLPNNSQTNGLAEFRSQMGHLHEAFPDWAEEIKLIVAEQDLVAIWFTASGTNTGSFFGNPPTGKKTANNVMSFFRIADNKIAEQWLLPDLFSMNSQLGLIPGKEASEICDDSLVLAQKVVVGMNPDDIQRNKKLALLANEQVWTLGNFNTLEEMFTGDFVQHFLPLGTSTKGLDDFRERTIAHREAFPDWTEVVNLIVAEGDYVFIQFTSTGINTGSFLGNPPTGKKIQINEMTIFRIVDDKIAEQWLLPDVLSLNQQLGFISSGQ